jgi:hypothetical protein
MPKTPKPTKAEPSSASEAGSGVLTVVWLTKSVTDDSVADAPGVVPPFASMSFDTRSDVTPGKVIGGGLKPGGIKVAALRACPPIDSVAEAKPSRVAEPVMEADASVISVPGGALELSETV